MNRLISRSWPWTLTLLFGVAVFLFWWLRYPFALCYQEQFQLFLFDGEYWLSLLGVPGGMARYAAEFLVQFNNIVVIGAAIVAVLLVLMQRLTWRLMKVQANTLYPLSFIPSLMMWYTMGSESVLQTFPVSVVIIQLSMLLYQRLSTHDMKVRLVALLVFIPLFYWIAGPVVLMLAFYAGVIEMIKKPRWRGIGILIAAVLVVILCVLLCSLFVPYPVALLFCGIGYYRFFEVVTLAMALTIAATVLMPFIAGWLSVLTEKEAMAKPQRTGLAVTVQIVALVAACLWLVPMGFDARTYELIEYDYLVRTQQWDKVIAKAEAKAPDLPMSVCATNLALAMKGQLDERAFEFYQRGTQGLLPPSERNFNSTLVTGEAYYCLGLVNTAQRFTFETMESLPNLSKSGRCIKRLAETNLINGEYEVARKYLKMLEKTIFYRKWAQRTMALLGNEEQINAHSVYGNMRRLRLQEDFLFSDRELDKICGQLILKNNDNRVAIQYLLLYPLLNRDISTFMNYLQFVQQQRPYSSPIANEAIALAYASLRQQPPQGLVPDAVLQRYNQFMLTYQSHGALEMYKNTLWYYFMQQ